MPGSRPASVRLIASQLRSTSPAFSASTSPKMCGWRRISFWRHVLGDLGQRPAAALLEQQREEVDLEEDVAELVEELGVVAGVRRGGELVGLLDGVRDDRALVLLAVPRALAPQPAGELVEGRDRRGRLLGRAHPRGAYRCRASGRRRRRRGWTAPGRGRRRRLRRVLAVLRHVALAALRLLLPLLAEVLDERVQRLLLVLRGQQLLDRRLGLLERLLRGLGDLVDLEDVVAELRLDRARRARPSSPRRWRRRTPSPAGPWRRPAACRPAPWRRRRSSTPWRPT